MRKAIENNKEYFDLVKDIIDHKEFKKIDRCTHHQDNRYDHSIRVSYLSYQIAKKLKLNYKAVARAGLLHDFFISEGEKNTKEKIITLFKHPKYALLNSKKYFEISPIEENIIASHMFPVSLTIPKYLESWIVDAVDDFVAIYELNKVMKAEMRTGLNLIALIILNTLR